MANNLLPNDPNKRCQSAPSLDDHNGWADFWRYIIGVNVIPADTRNKKINVKWSKWQNKPISEEQHNKWKEDGEFEKGLAVMSGRVWHRPDKQDEYFVILDLDKEEAINEICSMYGTTISRKQLGSKLLFEQHTDDKTRAHLYFYSKIPFVYKSADPFLGLEIKSLGEHGLSFCSNSVHMNKNSTDTKEHRYKIQNLHEPVTLTSKQAAEMMNHINRTCIRYGTSYLAKASSIERLKPMLRDLTIDKGIRISKGQRHLTLLPAADSLLISHLGNGKSEENLRGFFVQMNANLCEPEPLSEDEMESIWQSALEFVMRVKPAVENCSILPKELSVSQALREKSGYVKVTGQLIGQSSVYNMISAINLSCGRCGFHSSIDYGKKPITRSSYKEFNLCYSCTHEERGLTLKAEFDYCTTIDVELQDPEKFSEIERISVRLFEHNTENVIVGENVTITGNLDVVRKNDNPQNRPVTTLFAESIEYTRKEVTTLTKEDTEEIEKWKRTKESEGVNIIDALVSLFAPNVIGNEHVKEALLMVAANAGIPNDKYRIPSRLRLNQLLIGDPSLAKSILLRALVSIVPNARYESCQSSTGLSLTAQVSKEEGGAYILRAGPIPQAKGSLCALNEIGQMPISDHKHLLDFMEEGWSTLNKYGFNAKIAGYTSILASANPLNSTWKDSGLVDFSEFPTLVQIIHRFDFISVFREVTDENKLREYACKRAEIAAKFAAGSFENFESLLRKYIMYARTFTSAISDEAKAMLNDFWVKMAAAGVRGLPRKLDSLERAAISRAKLKLKNVADAEEAIEVMQFFNVMHSNFAQTVVLPRDVALTEICQVIRDHNGYPIAYVEAAKIACERNPQVKYYLGNKLELSKNWKLDNVLSLLRRNPSIQLVSEKPVVVRWRVDKSVENHISVQSPNDPRQITAA
jgi:DNA replicative helicase MCM subunit Mcm2 (Cdc46/Mcm family)